MPLISFRHGSEASLMSENQLDRGETYHLLSEYLHALTSITTSIDTIIENEVKQSRNNAKAFFEPISKKISNIQEIFFQQIL